MVEHLVMLWWLAGGQIRGTAVVQPPPGSARPRPTICDQAIAGGMTNAATELCLGEQEQRAGESAPRGDSSRSSRFRAAADHLRRGANQTSDVELKARAMDALARVFDAEHLNIPGEEESAICELIGLKPNDLAPIFRLADFQEKWGLIDLAEDTLVGACTCG